MPNIVRVKVRIEGTTPLLMNRFHDEAAMNATSGTRGAQITQSRGTPQEIAEKKIYRDLQNKACIPQPNLLRCLVEGGYFHKAGKKQLTTKKSSILYACLDIEGATIPLKHKEPWRIDVRPIVIPSTAGRILCHRPIFDGWSLEFILLVDVGIIDVKLCRSIVDDAGQRIGLGDFRPSCKGPFGKFVVTLWAVQEIPLQEAAE